MKSPISISSGITNGIIKFRTFICSESAFPSPVVSIVKTHFFGGKSFFRSTLNADKSYGISYQPCNYSLVIYKLKINPFQVQKFLLDDFLHVISEQLKLLEHFANHPLRLVWVLYFYVNIQKNILIQLNMIPYIFP